MDRDIQFVKTGYERVSEKYRKQKDKHQINISLFQEWLNHPQNTGKILELGCGSGYPIGEAIIKAQHQYLGIDLSTEQINLAHQQYPKYKSFFQEAEMLNFCRNAPDLSYSGIISFFSIRHLPRIYHVELYSHIFRLLQPSGLFLVDFPQYCDQGRDTWFDEDPMYWSSFSLDWNLQTLQELGFTKLKSVVDSYEFNGVIEETHYTLFQKII